MFLFKIIIKVALKSVKNFTLFNILIKFILKDFFQNNVSSLLFYPIAT